MNQVPINHFKRALQEKRPQIGLWSTLCSPYAAELIARAGFDWILFDMEHSPSDINIALGQLQAVAPYPVSPVLRPTWKDFVQQKRLLDIGAQTLLLPYVETAEEAALAVAGMRYPPRGIRGVAGSTRASGFGQVKDYMQACEKELCLLVQIESLQGLENLEAIACTDGVDGVFIGPADLSANMGHPGELGHPEVIATIEQAISRILACGKAPGILTTNEETARRCIDLGCLFTAVGVDTSLLIGSTSALAKRFKD